MNGWQSLGFTSYEEYLLSEYWQKKREWILEVFEYKCQQCKSKRKLQVHHLNYESVGNENQHDVIVLCDKCHKEKHNGC